MKNYILEVCVDSVESAINAENGGCNRLELCANLIIGGTTPSVSLFKEVKKHCNTKIHVLIRPRFGDFLYSDYEFEIIKDEIRTFRELGADGVVIGMLNSDGTLDIKRMKDLITLAEGMSVTLHRAFDVSEDPVTTLKQSIDLGIDTILTSGQKSNCVEGREMLSDLVKMSEGKIDILVAGGVTGDVIQNIYPLVGARSYHMSGKVIKNSKMEYRVEDVNIGIPAFSEYEIWQTDETLVRQVKEVLENIIQN